MKRTSVYLLPAVVGSLIVLVPGVLRSADEPRGGAATASPAKPAPTRAEDRAALEKKFSESLSGATLDGYFTETPGDEGKPKPSKYVINKASKIAGDLWLFEARIKYNDHDVTIPVPLAVRWAGDTPVITLDSADIPGFGSFTARVLIHDDSFAGMWSGGSHRGELYGRVVKGSENERAK
ncbi:MAG TPA: hypothetical protein VKB78_08770 [Pirellulales bacterium]|nr:hypothetical protein [Pirellulales bacterium]